ncbi:PICK1 protein, partial [Atractosteus spatula]|nr:PICK1 protein [Atractosteus spatula]
MSLGKLPGLKGLVPQAQGRRRYRSELTVDMISPPLGDFRHTMHVGRGGDVFGDTSFLSNHGGAGGDPETPERGAKAAGFFSRTLRHVRKTPSRARGGSRELCHSAPVTPPGRHTAVILHQTLPVTGRRPQYSCLPGLVTDSIKDRQQGRSRGQLRRTVPAQTAVSARLQQLQASPGLPGPWDNPPCSQKTPHIPGNNTVLAPAQTAAPGRSASSMHRLSTLLGPGPSGRAQAQARPAAFLISAPGATVTVKPFSWEFLSSVSSSRGSARGSVDTRLQRRSWQVSRYSAEALGGALFRAEPGRAFQGVSRPGMFTDMEYELEEDKLLGPRLLLTGPDAGNQAYSSLPDSFEGGFVNTCCSHRGIPTVPGTVTLKKDSQNLIGISIGGGAQYCPCLYIVQVFDNTPAALDGTLAAGDEITGVNGKPVKGKTKVEVAKMIQAVKGEVNIHYNKLQADPKQGKSLDIVLKKVKHRLVENMSSGTADALGLSRAILCNDGLVKRLEELEKTAELYKGLMEHTKRLLRAFFELSQTHRAFGDVFSVIGVREPQAAASEAFVKFAEAHRNIEKFGIKLLKTVKPMLHDLNTYLHKAIPDTKLTIRKYLDVKFEYLSYCLKVKEMDDEEYSCIALGEPLYRVSTGNYEYRLILRCRQEARTRFAKMRKDVLEKIELLDQKHVQDIVFQLQRFVSGMSRYYDECYAVLKEADVFPIEVDLSRTMINYGGQRDPYAEEEEEEEEGGRAGHGVSGQAENGAEKLIDDE